jgi:hypothetical protein
VRKNVAVVLSTTFIIAGLFLTTGCERQGPAEQAGKEVNQTVEKMKDVVNPSEVGEKAGKELDGAVPDKTK